MKIEEKGEDFSPITIILETSEEAKMFKDILNRTESETLEDIKEEKDWSDDYYDRLIKFDGKLWDEIDELVCDDGDC